MYVASLLFGISASLDALLVGVSYGIRGIRIRLWQNLGISTVTLLGTCLSVGLGRRMAQFLPAAVSRYGGSAVLILLGIYYIAKWLRSESRSGGGKQGGDCGSQNSRCKAPPDHGELLAGCDKTQERHCKMQNGDYGGQKSRSKAPPEAEGKTGHGLPSAAKDNVLAETVAASNTAAPPQLSLAEVFTLSLTLSLNNVSAGLSASLAGLSLAPTAAATFVCSILFLFSGSRLGQSSFFQLAGHAADPLSGVLLIGLGLVQLFL